MDYQLLNLINKGYSNRLEFVLCLFCRPLLFLLKTKKILKSRKTKTVYQEDVYSKVVRIGNFTQLRIRSLCILQREISKYSHLVYACILHGSYGNGEQIPYSDVDALIILKKDIFKDWATLFQISIKLNRLLTRFYDIDPIQHHGWFVILESQLDNYPQNYLPWQIFPHSRVLYPDANLELHLKIADQEVDYRTQALSILSSLRKKSMASYNPGSLYSLKAFLSQIMLLPSLYLQAAKRKPVYKKFSFDLAKSDFTEEEWEPICIASSLREMWEQTDDLFIRKLLRISNPAWRRIIVSFLPKVPKETSKLLDDAFYSKLTSLIDKMRAQIA